MDDTVVAVASGPATVTGNAVAVLTAQGNSTGKYAVTLSYATAGIYTVAFTVNGDSIPQPAGADWAVTIEQSIGETSACTLSELTTDYDTAERDPRGPQI